MATFTIYNPSRQHALVLYWLQGRNRQEQVRVPMFGTVEFDVDDVDKDSVFSQIDGQCKVLGLSFSEH